MGSLIDQCRTILEDSVSKCESKWIALSGGLDSSIIAHLIEKKESHAITIITKDFLGTDLTYAQIIAKHTNLPLSLMHVEISQILDSITNTVRILGNFNDIEIRNSIVPYMYLTSLKEKGIDLVISGDGADEIFAGYNFLLKKSENDLENEIERIKKIMHFPSKIIANSLDMKIETPFLDKNVIKFSEEIPISMKVNERHGKKFGKWILRKTFEEKIPDNVIWREKAPMQDGAGTSSLSNLFNTIITDEIFSHKRTEILEKDGVYLRSKESLHYYECFRKEKTVNMSNSDRKCPDCSYGIKIDSRFCKMCGKFPID